MCTIPSPLADTCLMVNEKFIAGGAAEPVTDRKLFLKLQESNSFYALPGNSVPSFPQFKGSNLAMVSTVSNPNYVDSTSTDTSLTVIGLPPITERDSGSPQVLFCDLSNPKGRSVVLKANTAYHRDRCETVSACLYG